MNEQGTTVGPGAPIISSDHPDARSPRAKGNPHRDADNREAQACGLACRAVRLEKRAERAITANTVTSLGLVAILIGFAVKATQWATRVEEAQARMQLTSAYAIDKLNEKFDRSIELLELRIERVKQDLEHKTEHKEEGH